MRLVMQCDFDCDGTLTYVRRVNDDDFAIATAKGDWHEMSEGDYDTIVRLLTSTYGDISLLGNGPLPDHASFKGSVHSNEW